MNAPASTVFIVDDDPAVRDSLTLMLMQEDIAVEAFDSAEAFLATYRGDRCGCAIIDIRMPGMNGMQLQGALAERGILLPIIFLTGHGDIPMSVRAIKAGAVDFLTKPVTRETLMECVRSAIQAGKRMFAQFASNQEAMSRLNNLTEREREVMILAVTGHPNKDIARRLGISHRTVEIHKSKIMSKTGAANLLDLARITQECGLSE